MRQRLSAVGAVLVGTVVAAGLFALVEDPTLAVVTGLFWAIGVGLLARHLRLEESRPAFDGNDWSVARWSGAFGGLMTLAAVLGVSPTLPISTELRLGLGLLVVGVALASVNLGAAMMLDARRLESSD